MDLKNEKDVSLIEKKLDLILDTLMSLKNDIDTLDRRISKIEGKNEFTPLIMTDTSQKHISKTVIKDFGDLDDHLKHTYQVLANENKPMTASEVAERMGRSRSTTSYHLNQLEKLHFLEKVPAPEGKARHVFFRVNRDIFSHKD
ncbi:MAG: helix-turn-helix domain-containing protein [Candidatus Hodarchaeales archaeon]